MRWSGEGSFQAGAGNRNNPDGNNPVEDQQVTRDRRAGRVLLRGEKWTGDGDYELPRRGAQWIH